MENRHSRRKAFCDAYVRLMDRQGFPILLCLCVAVIVVSSVVTFQTRERLENPSVTAEQEQAAQSVSSQEAQTLAEARALQAEQEKPVVPKPASVSFVWPLKGAISRGFADRTPVFFARMSYWALHPAIDIECEQGASVKAAASGTVTFTGEDDRLGLCVRIAHDDGYETLYAGLAEAPYVREGDPVAQGKTVGHAGNGVPSEADGKPHLHFAVCKDGEALNPISLLLGVAN